uniref:Clathrin binding box of aftiphilin containing 1 n=2 Tax=Canis lupus familiaris TaxID=9615 RepID=A0A8C0PX55_CANLF
MQGQRQRGAGPGRSRPPGRCPRDPAEGLRTGPRPPGGPEPAEHGSAWGEFEGFQEAPAKAGQFAANSEAPESPPHPGRQAGGTGAAGSSPRELALSYADVFRFAFQEVLVPQAAEGISPLDHVLDASGEGKPGCEPVHTLCSESRELWRALQNTNGMSASRCLWSKSRCQENFFLVLGIDAAQKDLSGDLGHIPECSDLKEPEEAGAPSRLQPCRALIQTKVSRPPGQARGPPWWHLRPEAHGLGTNGHCRCPEAAEHLEGSRCHRTAGRQQGLQGSRGAGAPEAQGRGARPGAPPTPF